MTFHDIMTWLMSFIPQCMKVANLQTTSRHFACELTDTSLQRLNVCTYLRFIKNRIKKPKTTFYDENKRSVSVSVFGMKIIDE